MDHRLPQALCFLLFLACSAENGAGGGAGGEGGGASAGGAATGGSGVGVPAACSDLAAAACDAIEACAPILIDIDSGSLALCMARRELGCGAELAAADSGYREADRRAAPPPIELVPATGWWQASRSHAPPPKARAQTAARARRAASARAATVGSTGRRRTAAALALRASTLAPPAMSTRRLASRARAALPPSASHSQPAERAAPLASRAISGSSVRLAYVRRARTRVKPATMPRCATVGRR